MNIFNWKGLAAAFALGATVATAAAITVGGWWHDAEMGAVTTAKAEGERDVAQAGATGQAQQRAIETQDSTAKEANHEIVNAELARARADAAGAYAAYQRLQREYADYLRTSAARAGASVAAGEPSTAPAAGMSADVLERYIAAADARAAGSVAIAGFADAAHASGSSCEREYDAVKAGRDQPSADSSSTVF